MAVDVVCPHCETKFYLQPEVVGKAMRCPECKDVFTVAAALEVPPTLPKELPYERIENAPPVILEAEAVPVPKRAVLLPPVPTAVAVAPPRARLILEPAVKEVDWRDAPPPTAAIEPAVAVDISAPAAPRNVWPLVLTLLIVTTVMLGVGAVGKIFYDRSRQEEYLAGDAAATFKDRNYPDAARQYGELIDQYPASVGLDKYRFFQALSGLQSAVNSSAVKEDPSAARRAWDAFVRDFGGSSFAKADDDGFGLDVYDAGRKLGDGYTEQAALTLRKYREEMAKVERLTAAEAAATAGRAFLPLAERFRPREEKPLDEARAKLDALVLEFARERQRLAVLAPYRDLAADPVEERIAEFGAAIARGGLSDDAEAKDLLTTANARLRSLLKPVLETLAPQLKIAKDDRPLVTIAVPAQRPAGALLPSEAGPEVFLALARGWLTALDTDSGEPLWSVRVGAAGAPRRTAAEVLLVPSLVDGHSGVTARRLRTGEALWHQPLAAPVAGAIAQVGPRVYVPLADAAGTLVEIDLRSGERLSHFRLRQRIGAGVLALPESNLIAVIADARRIYLLDIAPVDDQGERLPMRLRHVLQTGHAALSVRTMPTVSGERTLVLLERDGTSQTRVRAVAVPEVPPGLEVAESAAVDLAAAVLPGQVSFAPASDGERVAVATDTGALGIYRVNAAGNLDRGLFAIPGPALPLDAREPLPALAALSHEDGVWVFARGRRTELEQSFSPEGGFKLVVRGAALPCGVPTQPLQHFPAQGLAGVVLRTEVGDSQRAVLFDPASGRVRWERVLGAAAASSPIATAGGVLLIDTDGGVQILTATGSLRAERLAAPLVPTAGTARVAADGDTVWALIPLAAGRMQVRQIAAGRLAIDVETALPAAFAGAPRVVGGCIIAPLADGFLHRFDPATNAFTAGPMWRGPQASPTAQCDLVARGGDRIAATDGGRRIGCWRWPASGDWTLDGPALDLRDRAESVLALGTQLLAVDASGTVLLFEPDAGPEVVRRWKAEAGRPSPGLQRWTVGGRTLVVYGVDHRTLVALDPAQPAAVWTIRCEPNDYDLQGFTVAGEQLIVTDLAGTVSVYGFDGQRIDRHTASGDRLPRAAAAALPDGRLLLPLADGTVILLPALRKAGP